MDRLVQHIGIGWIVAAAGTLVANTGVEEGEQGGMGEWVGTLVITAIVAFVLYLILRRMTLSSTAGLVLAIIALAGTEIAHTDPPTPHDRPPSAGSSRVAVTAGPDDA